MSMAAGLRRTVLGRLVLAAVAVIPVLAAASPGPAAKRPPGTSA